VLVVLAVGLIRVYQWTLSPFMGGHCRFHPTCSVYAEGAYRTWGPWRGTWLTIRRLARCHPLGGHGFDPVPDRPAAPPAQPAPPPGQPADQRD
jgi:putative membrane protein insertion efficiency factor